MYQAVIFDLDGTLLNTIDDLAEAGNRVCQEKGWPDHSVEEYLAMVGHGIPDLVRRFAPPEVEDEAELASALERFLYWYGLHYMDKTCPYPGMPELLERLRQKGVRMAVYSNKAQQFTENMVRRYFPDIFSVVQGKVDGLPVKPAPEGVQAVLRQLGSRPEETLFVGDSGTDVQTGHNGDMQVCGVTWGFRGEQALRRAGADLLADTAAEVEAVILASR